MLPLFSVKEGTSAAIILSGAGWNSDSSESHSSSVYLTGQAAKYVGHDVGRTRAEVPICHPGSSKVGTVLRLMLSGVSISRRFSDTEEVPNNLLNTSFQQNLMAVLSYMLPNAPKKPLLHQLYIHASRNDPTRLHIPSELFIRPTQDRTVAAVICQ